MDVNRPSLRLISKKVTIGLKRIPSIPETASDQITPEKRSKARFRITMTIAKRHASTSDPPKQATKARNLRCRLLRIEDCVGLSFIWLLLLFACHSFWRKDINFMSGADLRVKTKLRTGNALSNYVKIKSMDHRCHSDRFT